MEVENALSHDRKKHRSYSHISAQITNAEKDKEKNLQNLLDTLHDFLFILDCNGQILHVNPAVEKRHGRTSRDYRGSRLA